MLSYLFALVLQKFQTFRYFIDSPVIDHTTFNMKTYRFIFHKPKNKSQKIDGLMPVDVLMRFQNKTVRIPSRLMQKNSEISNDKP
jgi:hypothetical protein